MSTKLLSGFMNTIADKVREGRKRSRTHSPEFKDRVVAQCRQPGASIAAVARANVVCASLLHRWISQAKQGTGPAAKPSNSNTTKPAHQRSGFVALPLPPATTAVASDIRIELRRGATAITMTWPCGAALECAAWMREVLR